MNRRRVGGLVLYLAALAVPTVYFLNLGKPIHGTLIPVLGGATLAGYVGVRIYVQETPKEKVLWMLWFSAVLIIGAPFWYLTVAFGPGS